MNSCADWLLMIKIRISFAIHLGAIRAEFAPEHVVIFAGINELRTVPTIVIAHTFCASRDTRISYGWCLLIQGYFCAIQNYAEKSEQLASALGIQKENWG